MMRVDEVDLFDPVVQAIIVQGAPSAGDVLLIVAKAVGFLVGAVAVGP